MATLPLRATMLPGAAVPALESVEPACRAEFDATPVCVFVAFWFMVAAADDPAPGAETAVPGEAAEVAADAEPIEAALEDGVASPYVAGGLLVPLIPSEPEAGETD